MENILFGLPLDNLTWGKAFLGVLSYLLIWISIHYLSVRLMVQFPHQEQKAKEKHSEDTKNERYEKNRDRSSDISKQDITARLHEIVTRLDEIVNDSSSYSYSPDRFGKKRAFWLVFIYPLFNLTSKGKITISIIGTWLILKLWILSPSYESFVNNFFLFVLVLVSSIIKPIILLYLLNYLSNRKSKD